MKVFSKEKYIKNMGKDAYNGVSKKWVDQCDGKTVEECGRMGFGIADSWVINVPETKKEGKKVHMYTMKDFTDAKIAIRIPDKETAKKVMQACHDLGLKWRGGKDAIDFMPDYGENMCITFGFFKDKRITQGTCTGAEKFGYKVVNPGEVQKPASNLEHAKHLYAGRRFRCIGYNKKERLFTVGKVYEIGSDGSITNDRGFTYRSFPGNAIDWLKNWYEFEEVKPEEQTAPEPYNRYKITIECDGKTTTARMEINGKEVKTAQAKRNPADAFNWRTGAETAFGRLWGKRENEGNREQPFRVGDRVACMIAVDGNESIIGKHGKIVYIDAFDESRRYSVDFDEKLECGHECGGNARWGHGWNCPANALRRE